MFSRANVREVAIRCMYGMYGGQALKLLWIAKNVVQPSRVYCIMLVMTALTGSLVVLLSPLSKSPYRFLNALCLAGFVGLTLAVWRPENRGAGALVALGGGAALALAIVGTREMVNSNWSRSLSLVVLVSAIVVPICAVDLGESLLGGDLASGVALLAAAITGLTTRQKPGAT